MNLSRFVDAQDRDSVYDHALAEVRNGAKVTHWMWFVYPQLAVLDRHFDGHRDEVTLDLLD